MANISTVITIWQSSSKSYTSTIPPPYLFLRQYHQCLPLVFQFGVALHYIARCIFRKIIYETDRQFNESLLDKTLFRQVISAISHCAKVPWCAKSYSSSLIGYLCVRLISKWIMWDRSLVPQSIMYLSVSYLAEYFYQRSLVR